MKMHDDLSIEVADSEQELYFCVYKGTPFLIRIDIRTDTEHDYIKEVTLFKHRVHIEYIGHPPQKIQDNKTTINDIILGNIFLNLKSCL